MPRQRERNAIPSEARTAAEGFIRFAIKIAYDGTDYQGFQSQAHGNTIQDAIETRLEKIVRRPLRIFGWGRTDSGVHARGAVITADFSLEEVERMASSRKDAAGNESMSDLRLVAARTLHSALQEFACQGGPGSITALTATPVPSDFDPRFSTRWKRYVYYISNHSTGKNSPFLNRYCWEMAHHLDVEKMVEASEMLNGGHNFRWLSVTQKGELRDPVRDLKLSVKSLDPGPFHGEDRPELIKISAVCDFFLYRMMRRLVGVLVAVGTGHLDLQLLEETIRKQDDLDPSDYGETSRHAIANAMFQTAPAKGLCLEHVEYEISI